MSTTVDRKWIMGIVGVLLGALISGGIVFAQDTHGRLSVVEDRTTHLETMRRDIASIQRDMSAICQAVAINRQCGSP